MRRCWIVTCGIVALAVPVLSGAQGLGDAAARARAKRAKEAAAKKAPPPTYSNEDLAARHAAGSTDDSTVQPSEGGATPDTNGSEPAATENKQALEQPYVEALAGAQARLDQLQARIKELEEKLNPLSTSFIYGPRGSNSATEEAQARAELTQAIAHLPEVQQALETAKRNLDDARAGRRPEGGGPGPQH